MDTINVFVIIGRGYTKQMIIKDIQEEGYKHNFFFGQGQEWDVLEKNMLMANEVWAFGDCSEFDTYEYAKEKGLDLWQMA